MVQQHSPAARIAVGSRVHFPHRCIRWSRCDGTDTGTVTQLVCGGMEAHWRDGHVCGQQFAQVLAPCGAMGVFHADELEA